MSKTSAQDLRASIEERIEEAFWQLIRDNPPERISVVALSKQAHCNRGTFYYYFTDIYDLVDRLIEKNIPQGPPLQVLVRAAQEGDPDPVVRALVAEEEKIKKLGFLLMRSDSGYCSLKLKDTLIKAWCEVLGLERDSMDKLDYLQFEFVASGILGMMAYMAKDYKQYKVEDLAMVLFPEVPQILVAHAARMCAERSEC